MTTPAARDWTSLDQLLAQDAATTRQLLDLFAEEREALQQRAYDHFELLLQRKGEALAALQAGTLTRRRWQEAHGLADDQQALAAADREAPATAAQWHELADLWDRCQQANRVNEQIAQRTRTVVGRLLDILSGNAGMGGTYDASGGKRRLQSGRNITTA
jgi:flagellar biosynthesis/type III secretory pathway chaperone